MKVLVDSCVWSLSLRRRNKAGLNPEEQRLVAALTGLIQDGRAAMLGVTRQEVLSGIRDSAQFEKTRKLLDPFPGEEVKSPDYVEAARLFNLCRNRGVKCGPVDMLICTVAARNRWDVLTHDQGLLRCVEALRAEGVLTRHLDLDDPNVSPRARRRAEDCRRGS